MHTCGCCEACEVSRLRVRRAALANSGGVAAGFAGVVFHMSGGPAWPLEYLSELECVVGSPAGSGNWPLVHLSALEYARGSPDSQLSRKVSTKVWSFFFVRIGTHTP
jgi:hypothetical protein